MINLLFNTNTLTLVRDGNTITQHITMQIDNLSNAEASYYGGAAPYFRFNGYTSFTNVVFRLGDQLKDEQNIDSRTNAPAVYRIINQPEVFTDHVELVLDKVVGV